MVYSINNLRVFRLSVQQTCRLLFNLSQRNQQISSGMTGVQVMYFRFRSLSGDLLVVGAGSEPIDSSHRQLNLL
jgi:hypothetical protein